MGSDALRYGPYAPPRVRVGEYVTDEARGLVRVHSWTEAGALMWPRGIANGPSPGRPALIVMGDLVRALHREAAVAVMRHWGVSNQQVRRWRRAIGVGPYTEGTRRVLAEGGNPDIARYAPEGAAALNSKPDSRAARDATHAATMRAKPGWADHMRALGHKRKYR